MVLNTMNAISKCHAFMYHIETGKFMVLNNYEWYYKYHSGIIETGKCAMH